MHLRRLTKMHRILHSLVIPMSSPALPLFPSATVLTSLPYTSLSIFLSPSFSCSSFFHSLNPFPLLSSFCFPACSQLPLSPFLLSSSSVHHISFTQLLVLPSPLPELNGQGERSELDLACREQQAAPREAETCVCVHARVCAHV